MRESPFRDSDEGARARRRALLEARRDEYALMPHLVRRLYVRRASRATAGAVAAAGATALAAAALAPGAYAWLSQFVPGPRPALLSSLLLVTWVTIAVVYFIARSAAEDRYARVTSKTILPSDDLYRDLDRLQGVRPAQVAQQLADRLEQPSTALPLLGIGLLAPPTLLYAWLSLQRGALAAPDRFDDVCAHHYATMIPAMVVLAVLSLAFARRLRREPTQQLAESRGLMDSAFMGIGALFLTAFGSAIGAPWTLLGVGLLGFVIATHLMARRILQERLGLAPEAE